MKDSDINDHNVIEKKIYIISLFRNLVFSVFILMAGVNIGSYYLFDVYLPQKYPAITEYILYAFLMLAVLLQSYLYILFRRKGEGREFLKERGLILTVSLILIVAGFLVVELY